MFRTLFATLLLTISMQSTLADSPVEAGRVCEGITPVTCVSNFAEVVEELEDKCKRFGSRIDSDVQSNIECSPKFEKCSIIATAFCEA